MSNCEDEIVWIVDQDCEPKSMTYDSYIKHCFRFASKCGLKIRCYSSKIECEEYIESIERMN